MAAPAHKPKRFRLSLVNAAEDVPRLIRAYGRACDGEFALVMRPRERRSVLVLMTKRDGARVWRSGDLPIDDGHERAQAEVERAEDGQLRLRVLDGPHAGVRFRPYDVNRRLGSGTRSSLYQAVGSTVLIDFVPDDQLAHVVASGDERVFDAPAPPQAPIAPDEAVKQVKAEQRKTGRAGPITLRGQWSGYLYCDGGEPRVELRRKLATYGVLTLVSNPDTGWTWTVERTEKWFSKPGDDTGSAATLLDGIEAGLGRAMGLLGEACSMRDSRRRSAFDPGWAEKYPIKPAREGKNPTERLKARPVKARGWTHFLHDDEAPESEQIARPTKGQLAILERGGLVHDPGAGTFLGRTTEAWSGFPVDSLVFREAHDNGFHVGPVSKARGRRKAAPPAPVDAPVSLPDVPATSSAMRRMEQEITAEADALADLRGLRWVWMDSGVREDVTDWFQARELDALAEQIREYDGSPDRPLEAFIDGLKGDVRSEGLAAADQQEAVAWLDKLRAGWMEAPQLMERARRLIRYAAVMAESKLCQGKEQREAVDAIQRAIQAYDDARIAITAGRAVDGVRTLRRIGERVALSAAKAARSCAQGQQSLTAIASGAAGAQVPAPAAAGGWKVGDRFLAGSRSGVVIDVPQAGARVVGVRWDSPIDIGRGETVTESRLRTGEMKDPATGRARPQQLAPPVRAASGSGRGVDTTTVPGLTIVDVGTVPTTADELRALTAGHAEAFGADPKASTAKKWVKSALLHLGLEALNLSAKSRRFDDLGGGRRVFVTVLLPAGVEAEATDDKLRLVAEATPRGLSVEDWDYAEAGGARARRGRAAATAARPRVVAAPTQAPAAEGEVDAEKDKALLDAFSAAIAAAMREAG